MRSPVEKRAEVLKDKLTKHSPVFFIRKKNSSYNQFLNLRFHFRHDDTINYLLVSYLCISCWPRIAFSSFFQSTSSPNDIFQCDIFTSNSQTVVLGLILLLARAATVSHPKSGLKSNVLWITLKSLGTYEVQMPICAILVRVPNSSLNTAQRARAENGNRARHLTQMRHSRANVMKQVWKEITGRGVGQNGGERHVNKRRWWRKWCEDFS